MTKADLLRVLEPFADDIEIVVSNDEDILHVRHTIVEAKYKFDWEIIGTIVLIAPSIDGL